MPVMFFVRLDGVSSGSQVRQAEMLSNLGGIVKQIECLKRLMAFIGILVYRLAAKIQNLVH